MTSASDDFLASKYTQITQKAIPECSHPAAFISESALKDVWSEEKDIKRALGTSKKDDVEFIKNDSDALKTLSTLVLINVLNLKQVLAWLCPQRPRPQAGSRFPFQKDELDRLSVQHRDAFFEKQYLFCPIVIENRQNAEIVYKDVMYRWPFMDAESPTVGSGGYGSVRKNRIAPYYYRDHSNPDSKVGSPDAQMVAFKVFSNKDDFQLEKRNLDYLKEGLSDHEHVILHLAAIVRGPEFYIFLPYTDLGSLEVFLCGGIDETPGTDLHKISYDFDAKFPSESIRPVHLLGQMMNLCGALRFLHHELHDGQSQTYCAHLDLRPQNVLVFGAETEPGYSFKISDFGISSFKKVHNTKERVFLSIRDVAEPQTSTATNRNLEGAHRSPENHSTNTEPFSGRKSDMWSFACILCEVLAFALGGKDLLKDFHKQRTRGNAGENDAFFSFEEKKTADSPTTEPIINGSVVNWLQGLSDRFAEERFLVENVVEIILSTLKIVPGERLRAKEVYEKLELMLRNHSNPSGTAIAPPPNTIDNGSDPVPKHDDGGMQDGVLDPQPSLFRASTTQLGIRKLDLPVSTDSA